MLEIKLLGPPDLHILNNVAENVFDDPIVESSARASFSAILVIALWSRWMLM